MAVEILDNFVDSWYQDALYNFTVGNRSFPWSFLDDMSGYQKPRTIYVEDIAKNQWGFQHVVMDHQGDYQSEYASIFVPLVEGIRNHVGNIELVRIKIGMVLPVNGCGVANPHVDYISPHKTLVYYVSDSDGDTVFYDEWYDGTDRDYFNVQQRVSARKGRAVIFDGLQYHSTQYPSSDIRAFVNINYKEVDK